MSATRTVIFVTAFVAASAAVHAAHAAPSCAAQSGAGTAALLELYTSEGCSSCPPADRWLSALAERGLAGERVVPLGLHVDYWDYIGWKDRFASAEFSARQRDRARSRGATFVYTPQVVLDGEDFRSWSGGAFERALASINARPARAQIVLEIVRQDAGAFELEVRIERSGAEARSRAALYLAAYENGIESRVAAGENRGRRLQHDFVVRAWSGPILLPPGERIVERRRLELPRDVRLAQAGVAAFVEGRPDRAPLQALMRPACPV